MSTIRPSALRSMLDERIGVAYQPRPMPQILVLARLEHPGWFYVPQNP
jgi:hypothetical protein